jgi:hypothetical protein
MISRREMFKGALVLGGASVMGSRAAAGVIGEKGSARAGSIAFAHINAGAEKPFAVFHISDTHLTFVNSGEDQELIEFGKRRSKTFGERQMEALNWSIGYAKTSSDMIVHTGDLIDFMSEGNLEALKDVFARTDGMFFGSAGNHEWQWRGKNSNLVSPESREKCEKAFPFNVDFASRIMNGVNFVSIDDTLIDVKGQRGITADHMTKFENEVKKGLPIILCMHVPFRTPSMSMASRQFWGNRGKIFTQANMKVIPFGKDTEDFIAYLKNVKLLKGILAGHNHFTFEERFSPTAMQYIVAGNYAFTARHVLFT